MAGLIMSGMLAFLAVAFGRIIIRMAHDPEDDARRAAEVATWNARSAEECRRYNASARLPAR